jgi:hypothetical protein
LVPLICIPELSLVKAVQYTLQEKGNSVIHFDSKIDCLELPGSCESRLTRSMVSSFSSAGRFIRMSDLGEVAITCWNWERESQQTYAMRIEMKLSKKV